MPLRAELKWLDPYFLSVHLADQHIGHFLQEFPPFFIQLRERRNKAPAEIYLLAAQNIAQKCGNLCITVCGDSHCAFTGA